MDTIWRFSLCASLVALTSTTSALAIEADQFTSRLQAAMGTTDVELSFEDVAVNGDEVVLSDVVFTPAGGSDIRFDTMTFSGVTETGDGGYTVEEASIPDVEVEEDDTSISIRDLTMSSLTIPGETTDADFIDSMVFYEQARSGPLTVAIDDEDIFRFEELVIDVTRRPDGNGLDTELRAEGLFADLTGIEDERARRTISALGYEEVTGRMSVAGGWNPQTGELDLSNYELAIDDAGLLSLGLGIGGYTQEFVQTVQETQVSMEQSDNPEMAGMAMLGLLQQLTFRSAMIRFEDDGLTDKALEFAGEQQGVGGAEMADALKGMMPLFLGRLQNPEFQSEIAAAVSAFLDSPQSLTIIAEPDEPLPFPAIMGGFAAPEALPDLLNVTVSANE